MKKVNFIDLVIEQLSGGTPALKQQSKFHPVVVEKQISLVFNSLISEIKDQSLLQQYCVRVDNVAVQTSGTRQYSVIPKSYLTTLYCTGLWVYPAGGDVPFSLRLNNSAAVYNSLEVSQIWTKGAYSVEGQNIRYQVLPLGVTEVDMVMLVPFDELNDDDNIIMPGGKDSEAFQAVLAQMRELKTTPEKYNDDGNNNTN